MKVWKEPWHRTGVGGVELRIMDEAPAFAEIIASSLFCSQTMFAIYSRTLSATVCFQR
jgi:hypothetical protein